MDQGHVFIGQGGGNAIYDRAADASLDAGTAYDLRGRTVRFMAAGAEGDAIYRDYVLLVTHLAAVTLRITPYIDNVALETQDVTFAARTSWGTEKRKFGLSIPVQNALGTTVLRRGVRGTVFEIQVDSVGGVGGAGDPIVEVSKLTYRVVTPSVRTQALT